MDPWYLTVAGLAGIVVFASAALTGIIWQRFARADIPPQIVINAPPTAAPPGPAASVKLEPNEIPDVSVETAKRVARYWQLKDAIPRAQELRKAIKETGEFYKNKMKPSGTNLASVGWVMRWQNAINGIAALNNTIYKGAAIDLQSAPDLAYQVPAPGESEFKEDDPKGRYEYRAFHFRFQNILKQTDQLISNMDKEAVVVRAETIKSVPPEQLEN
jgi:hypothetical protein